ncbi:CorA-like Mg2+ transporter protein [Paracoccus lutimaris]|uniref:CorA-like Mg2+ transporter protein n=1 Tax=Paracoccus lutimaris TaxID=1490030 RepID=A0A368Z2P1_9RHOB|nr:CorA-like Mg2+ transporter protein [Paracoccus lutimaris]
MLDTEAAQVLRMPGQRGGDTLQEVLVTVGQQAELMNRIRMGLLSLDRILVYQAANAVRGPDSAKLRPAHAALQRDIQALEEHASFLSGRIGMTVDATMGMIGLMQNDRVRSLSVVAALFLPPTLIASIYGMNFEHMPILELEWGFHLALGMMVGSVVLTVLVLKWMKWD